MLDGRCFCHWGCILTIFGWLYAEKLYALANDAFAKVDKGVVESQLVDVITNCGRWNSHMCDG